LSLNAISKIIFAIHLIHSNFWPSADLNPHKMIHCIQYSVYVKTLSRTYWL